MKKINGKRLAKQIRSHLKREVKREFISKKKLIPKLVVLSVNPDPEGSSFIKMKEKATREMGGEFELISYRKTPRFEDFAQNIRRVADDPKVTGIVIQKPLPAGLNTMTLFDYVPTVKEIEGHKNKTPFYPPIALAALTPLKYLYAPGDKRKIENIIVDLDRDQGFFKQVLKRKKIVVAGTGETGGKPIGDVLTRLRLNYINVNSKTPNADSFYREADIIITCVGKKILHADDLKPGVILLNIGLRRENNVWRGDYDEEEVKDIASFYTPTPGGVGPLDIAYLMYNLVDATRMQL